MAFERPQTMTFQRSPFLEGLICNFDAAAFESCRHSLGVLDKNFFIQRIFKSSSVIEKKIKSAFNKLLNYLIQKINLFKTKFSVL